MAGSAAPADGLEVTTVHEVLSNERRYRLLETLEEGETAAVGDLAETIAGEESDGDDPSDAERQSVYVALIQNHLPKLDGMDVVEYDDDQKTVALGPNHGDVRAHMDDGEGREFLYPVCYWAIAIVGLTGHLWVFPVHVLATVMLLSLALIVIVSLSIVEGFQYATERPEARVAGAGLLE